MKVLIISYFFTPSSCANSKRPYYITKGLLDEGWDVDVIASYRLMPKERTESIQHSNLKIQRIEDPYDVLEQKMKNQFWKLFLAGLRGLLWPDTYTLWALKILRKINTKKYDRIFICIMPISMILFSLFKKVSSKWIFDYSESFSPSKPVQRKSPVPYILRPILTKLQRMVLSRAGSVLFTSEATRQEYLKQKLVGANKAIHIPLFYNKTDFKGSPPPKDQFVIGYMGKFGDYQKVRSPDVFFKALNIFLKRIPKARQSMKFVFHGRWNSIHTHLISQYKLEDVVEIHPSVPHKRYLELLEESSVLLLVASPEQNLMVPSKMLDYFGAKRPILAFIPFESETYSMMKNAKMEEFSSKENDAESGAQCLELLWNNWLAKTPNYKNSHTEQWSFSFQMPRILNVLTDKKSKDHA